MYQFCHESSTVRKIARPPALCYFTLKTVRAVKKTLVTLESIVYSSLIFIFAGLAESRSLSTLFVSMRRRMCGFNWAKNPSLSQRGHQSLPAKRKVRRFGRIKAY